MNYKDKGLNQFLQPEKAPIARESITTSYDFDYKNERGVVTQSTLQSEALGSTTLADGAVTEGKIASFAVTSSKIGTAAVGTTALAGSAVIASKIAATAVTNAKINDFDFAKGTGVISVASGTISGILLGTSQITGGTLAAALVGTSTLTGGTVNPTVYQTCGTVGTNGTVIYIKTVDFSGSATTSGTVIFNNGIAISIT